LKYKIYSSVSELPDSWDELPIEDVFLKTAFLSALETSSPSNIKTYFVGIFIAESLVAKAIVQHVQLFSKNVFRGKSDAAIKELGKRFVSFFLKGNALVLGNLMHTGQHAFWFDENIIKQRQCLEILLKAIENLSERIIKQSNQKINIIAYKDFFENDPIHLNEDYLKSHSFFKARVQPNMVFKVKDSWYSTEDYLSNFNKKYRRRYRTAIKKKNPIQVKELNLITLRALNGRVYGLYENVSDNAGVNSFKLHNNHFLELKQKLRDDFKIVGYFIDNELVGFFSLIPNGHKLETYFLGYDTKLQRKHQIYLNMLFDMVDYGISNAYKEIVFARTAMEIKSSVGAKPFEMSIYLKHTNTFVLNPILKNVVKFMNPVRHWDERHPFKLNREKTVK